MRIGALEAGGTKMVCALGDEGGAISERHVIATTTPDETMPQIAAWFRERGIEALGIGCFGPLDLDKDSKTYGHIAHTPKQAWRDFDLLGYMRQADIPFPIGFDTDVNAACLGEASWGNMRDVDCGIYITVGTGIGVGVLVNGRLLHGLRHPEAGHILIGQRADDNFAGVCPYHRGSVHCLEGLASGPAIVGRWGERAESLHERPGALELEAHYLAAALATYILTLSPKRIIIGGGVMKQARLYPLVREKTAALLNDYVTLPDLDGYIVPPALGDDAGIKGAIKLALLAS